MLLLNTARSVAWIPSLKNAIRLGSQCKESLSTQTFPSEIPKLAVPIKKNRNNILNYFPARETLKFIAVALSGTYLKIK